MRRVTDASGDQGLLGRSPRRRDRRNRAVRPSGCPLPIASGVSGIWRRLSTADSQRPFHEYLRFVEPRIELESPPHTTGSSDPFNVGGWSAV